MQLRHPLAFATMSIALAVTASAFAQTQAPPSAPAPQPSTAAPAAPAAPPPFPMVDRANFTATSPTTDTVNAFLKSSWGYDPNRLWQVQAIQKTQVQGLSKVVVLVEEKGAQQQQPQALSFFVLPDGNHLITMEEVLPFGADPYADYRKLLQARAEGPSRGAASKSLLMVEFSDFQCPHCKDAQPTIDRLLKDFPNAHFVYENYPLKAIHTEALKSAQYSACIAKEGGNEAFFKFADNIFSNQAKLTPEASVAALKDAATAAGQDPEKTATCAASPEAAKAVDASVQLAHDLGVTQTPTLYVNGRGLPLGGIPYDTLKQIVAYQASLDGVPAGQ